MKLLHLLSLMMYLATTSMYQVDALPYKMTMRHNGFICKILNMLRIRIARCKAPVLADANSHTIGMDKEAVDLKSEELNEQTNHGNLVDKDQEIPSQIREKNDEEILAQHKNDEEIQVQKKNDEEIPVQQKKDDELPVEQKDETQINDNLPKKHKEDEDSNQNMGTQNKKPVKNEESKEDVEWGKNSPVVRNRVREVFKDAGREKAEDFKSKDFSNLVYFFHFPDSDLSPSYIAQKRQQFRKMIEDGTVDERFQRNGRPWTVEEFDKTVDFTQNYRRIADENGEDEAYDKLFGPFMFQAEDLAESTVEYSKASSRMAKLKKQMAEENDPGELKLLNSKYKEQENNALSIKKRRDGLQNELIDNGYYV